MIGLLYWERSKLRTPACFLTLRVLRPKWSSLCRTSTLGQALRGGMQTFHKFRCRKAPKGVGQVEFHGRSVSLSFKGVKKEDQDPRHDPECRLAGHCQLEKNEGLEHFPSEP